MTTIYIPSDKTLNQAIEAIGIETINRDGKTFYKFDGKEMPRPSAFMFEQAAKERLGIEIVYLKSK